MVDYGMNEPALQVPNPIFLGPKAPKGERFGKSEVNQFPIIGKEVIGHIAAEICISFRALMKNPVMTVQLGWGWGDLEKETRRFKREEE